MNKRALVLTAFTCTALLVCAPAALADDWHHNSDDQARLHSSRAHRHLDVARGDRWDDSRINGDRRDAVWMDRDDEDADEDDSDDGSDDSGDVTEDDSDTTAGDVVGSVAGSPVPTVLSGAEKAVTAELTAYDHSDNQGGNNARICCPTWHREASGSGTFQDPITVAVPGSGSSMETKAGTRIYVPALQVYLGVEDSGATPTGKMRLDIWIDGRGLSSASACMDRVTRTTQVIVNPAAGKPVGHVGPIADASGCHVLGGGD